ncbi:WD40 repeat-containing protein [Cryptosporidium ubiquitum]|uniref:WD40 repeat-containing protein n=1 Tax=Cryptosporidium ubiquitum TaxID=857276 RepID=A0A1J4MJU9_9CRYT|nr:WD40 repeat-containing protein [Cryptosporidium ubiquitum]OII73125.1 WD40 repeat-containing protein [Cryptosporidium ubiquitum]
MEPYYICRILKEYGLDDVSNKVFEKFKTNSEIPIKINYDGTESQITYEELTSGPPDNIFRFIKLFLSFIKLCKFNKNSIIGSENLISNQDKFFDIIHSLKNEIIDQSNFVEKMKYICSRTTHLSLRGFRYGVNDQLMFSNTKMSQLLPHFFGEFIQSNFIYAHQHIEDSEFGVGGEPASVYVIKKDRTGNVLISGGDDGMIRLWNTYTGNLLVSVRKHAGDIIDLDINSCNALLASCCGKGQLLLTLLNGNDWVPITIIENTDRLTYVRFAYSKHSVKSSNDDIFHESEMLISAGDNAIITIYKVSDLFMHGVSHYLTLMKRKEFTETTLSRFKYLFKRYGNFAQSSDSFEREKSLFYKAPPLYKIDIFPLSPKAFDICLNPLYNHGFSSNESLKSYFFFSVGASLHSLSSTEEIQINISGKNISTEVITIQKQCDGQGYSLVFMISLENLYGKSGIHLIDMPQKHCEHPDVSFANNSHDLVTASDDGTIIMWTFSNESIHSQINLTTYISDRISSNSYSKKKSASRKNVAEKSPTESLSDDDSDYVGSGSMDENSILRRNPIRTSRFVLKDDSFNKENNRSNGADGSPNVVQFIDSIQWSCDDSIIFIAQSVASKGMLRRNRNSTLVNCIECCISYFSRNNGKRFLDVVLPGTCSRIACLIPHPMSPEIVLSLTYNGVICVISGSKSGQINDDKLKNSSSILFEHKNTKNPYLNGIWIKNGLGFVVSQKYGSFEIYNICNNRDLNQQVLIQSYRYSFPEQFFLNDFSEILRDDILGWIDPNLRKPIYMMPRSVIVDRNKRMYTEDVQPPTPLGSSLGIESLRNITENELLTNRIPIFSEQNISNVHKTQNSNSEIYLERAKKRLIHRKKVFESIKNLFNNYSTSNNSTLFHSGNTLGNINEELTWVSSQTQNDETSSVEEAQSYLSDSSNDEDFDINHVSNTSTNRRLRMVGRRSPSISDIGSSSSSSDSSLDENDYDSDLTSEDSLYNEIRGSKNITRPRRGVNNKGLIHDSNSDNEIVQQEIEFRYYALSNLDTIWAPDSEEQEINHLVVCKLCNKSSTTIIGYKYLIKSGIEFNSQNIRPILHGVNGSIDLGPLIGPFDYRYSTHRPERNAKFLPTQDLNGGQFYLHSRCLITIPFLQWELINDQIYTNLFDIIKRIYNPSEGTPPLPKNGLYSTFFDSKIVKFPKLIATCSYCHEYGASILCQGGKCSRQFHYHCSSLVYHSFPESINSSFISPRESNMYWCDIMQFYLFYCPKCINLKQSNVPYCPKRENMIDNTRLNHCNRSWLLVDEVSAGYVPQINDYLYFFPNAYICSGLDDIFFKNILLEVGTENNKKPSRRSNKKFEFIKCKLVNISYAFPNSAEQSIKAILTFSTELISGRYIYWQIRCSPNDGPDYLVLEEEVEKGIYNLEHRLRIGQENYMFIDNQWHEIVIKNIKQNVIWESIEVSWKQEESSNNSLMVSPWEIHEIVPDKKSVPKNLEASDDLIKIFCWMLSQNGQSNPLSIVEFFKYPIPFFSNKNLSKNEYSNQEWVMHYWKEIPLPFSFISIINRINNNYYRRMESLVFDIFLVRSNCEHFNINNNNLVQGIRSVEYELLRLIFSKRLPRYIIQTSTDISFLESEPEKKISAVNSSTFDSDEEIINRLGKRTRRRL